MKWLSKKGSRGIAYFMIMVLVLTSVLTGDVMRVKADDDDSQPAIYTCSLSVSSYDGEHGCIEYLSDEGNWETVGSDGADSVSAKAVRFSAEEGWYVSQVEYNGGTIDNPANQYDFDSSGDKSVTGISFSRVDQDDENDSQDDDTDQNQEGDIDQNQDTDQDLEQNPPVYACTLNVSEYDTEHGYIEYLANSGEWTAVSADGCTATATAVRFGAIDGWHVSQIVYNDNPIDDPETDHFDFSEVGDKKITGITFEETVPARRNAPQILRNTPPAGYCLLMGEYSTDHGKIQYSNDNGSTWEDIPYTGLAEQTPATHVRAVITTEGYGVSYEVEDSIYTDTDSHALTGDRNVQWIQRVTFSNPNKSLTVSEYDATKGTVKISTDGTTWTSVAAAGGNVTARYVKVVHSGNYVLNSYKINNNTIYSESSQELTAENNTLSEISFIENSGGGKFNLNLNDQTNGASTVTVTFLDSEGSSVGTASAGSDVNIPGNTAKIRIVVSNKDLLNSIQLIRRCVGADETDNGVEILRQELEESLWDSGTVEFAASNAYNYRLNVTLSNTKNVMWDYRESARGSDTFVEHCQLFLLDEHGARLAYHDDVANRDTTDYVAYNLTIGESYQFELVPDYGYQISGLTINGYTVEPADNTGVFDFTMTNSNFHFAGVVTPAVDLVSVPQAYGGATISNGSNAADSGNVRMTIAEETLDNSAASIVGNDATAVATLDIDLDKVVSKGDGSYWSDNITAFTNDVTVSIPVPADGLSEGQTYTVVRDHNGVKTALNATYNSSTGMLTFDSNRFSDYTVVKTAGEPDTTPADPVDSVNLTVRFEGTQYDHYDVHMSPDEVIQGASPVLYRKIGNSGNDYETYTNGQSFTVTPGQNLPIYVKLSDGYTLDEGGCGTKVGQNWEFFLSDSQYVIAEGHEDPGSASYSNLSTTDQCTFSSMDLVIKIYRIDDPNEDPNGNENYQPGKASSFSVSFKDDSNDHVQVVYHTLGSGTDNFVDSEGVSNVADVEWFRIIPDPGYVVTGDETIVITQTAGTDMGTNDVNDNLVNFDPPVGQWGFGFIGNELTDPQNVYTCTISNIEVREATPSELLGKYRMVLVTKDGVSLSSNLDAGAMDANNDEIDTTYTRIEAGSTSGSTGYVDLPNGATQLFVTMNPADGNNFETATLVGYDENGDVVSRVSYDYDEIKNNQMGKRPIDPRYSYVLTVTFSKQKKIYWTSADSAKCTLYLLSAQGNEDPDPTQRRGGTEFLAQINETYYFLMIPNYGYQVDSLVINGNTITPIQGNDNMGIFCFVMGNADFHIQPSLKTSSDTINNASTKVGSPSIANGAAAGVGGNLSMSVADVATDVSAVDYVSGGGDISAVATVNINMNQIVSQGNGTNWNKQLTDLDGDVTLSLAVPANGLETGETYSVVRHHGIEMKELRATYNSSTGLLTFPTNGFSEYTIVKKPGTPETNPAPPATKDEDTESDSGSTSDSNDDNDDNNGSTGGVFANTLGSIVNKTATGGLVANTVIKDWNDLDKVLLDGNTNTASNKKKVLSDKEKARGELVQVVLNKKDTTVPASTFESLYRSNKSGLHVFVASGTALTFMNNYRLKGQKALDLSCTVTGDASSKTITFKTKAKLNAKTKLHTTVPTGVKWVTLYKYDKNGKLRRVRRARPTHEGRICFDITELTTYVLVYEY